MTTTDPEYPPTSPEAYLVRRAEQPWPEEPAPQFRPGTNKITVPLLPRPLPIEWVGYFTKIVNADHPELAPDASWHAPVVDRKGNAVLLYCHKEYLKRQTENLDSCIEQANQYYMPTAQQKAEEAQHARNGR